MCVCVCVRIQKVFPSRSRISRCYVVDPAGLKTPKKGRADECSFEREHVTSSNRKLLRNGKAARDRTVFQ